MTDEATSLAPAPALKDPPPRRSVFLSRLASTVVLWALISWGLSQGWDTIFTVPVIVLALLGVVEFLLLFGLLRDWRYSLWTLGLSAAYLLVTYFHGRDHAAPERAQFAHWDVFFLTAHLLGVLSLTLTRSLEGRLTLERVCGALLAFFYVAFLFQFVARVLLLPASGGVYYSLFLVVVTKFSDMGAYAIGSLWGRRKMIPRISPGKTWEGLGGAYFGSLVGALSIYFAFARQMPRLTLTHALILSFVLCTVAVIGDLAESAIKRCTGAKDSGHSLPGIGGVLDLIDSILFTAPVMYLYMSHVLDYDTRP